MTPNLLDELLKIVALSEKAAPGRLELAYRDESSQYIIADDGYVAVTHCWSRNQDCMVADASFLAEAANFLRTHASALADMAKRMESAERDAARYRWLRGLDSQFMLKKYGCGDLPVDEDLDAEIDAAIDATQEGEG